MSLNHGINTYKSDTSFSTVTEAAVGVPFFVGAWPCHQGSGFAGKPQIAYSYNEAYSMGGYSNEWRTEDGKPKWNLCQAIYAQFRLTNMAPAVFYNIFDPTKHIVAVGEAVIDVTDHIVTLPGDVIGDSALTVSAESDTLEKGSDYEVYYENGNCIIELLSGGRAYTVPTLTVAYNIADPGAITSADVEAAIEKIEECKGLFGIVPDLICCPGWSSTPSVAAVMAAKAASINGLFRAKAVVDIDTAAADDYQKVLQWKNDNGYTDEYMIVCWPLVKSGDYVFDYSAVLCGHMASIDQGNGDCPYESPSNKTLPITGACDIAGKDINLSVQHGDILSISAGVVTAINFDGWRAWGNYTGCYPGSSYTAPGNSDVAKIFIGTSRMMDFLCNTFINSYWSYVDKPLTPVMRDAIINSFNSYLDGLTHDGKLYGGEMRYIPDNNPTADLLGGKLRLDTKMAAPVPAQEINMYMEYDVDIMTNALNS